MITDQELMRIKLRAENLLKISKSQGKNSLLYHVLKGDAHDVMNLLEEIMDLKKRIYKMRKSDFTLMSSDRLTPQEIKVLLKGGKIDHE